MKAPVSGQVSGWPEFRNVALVALSKHYGGGKWTRIFERLFAKYMGAREAILCNSGSSANLLALASLELPKGSEVVTCAVNFPTTVNAILQLGLTPVFVDADPKTLNARPEMLEAAITRWTGAVVVAHTLGNPVDLTRLSGYNVPIIEDCCDAIGSTINGRMVGRMGTLATASFYPAHHITMGEGGAVLTDSPRLRKIVESYRDWGRDCWCEPGKDNTCGRRWCGAYDHKYTYSRVGFNLKASDFQAAVGCAQLDRLRRFVAARRTNREYLRVHLAGLPLEAVDPTPRSIPSWFGFAFLAERRNELGRYLDARGIGNRPIMAGNLLRQPAYRDIPHRIVGTLDGANDIHERGLWVGCWPGLSEKQLAHTAKVMREFYA